MILLQRAGKNPAFWWWMTKITSPLASFGDPELKFSKAQGLSKSMSAARKFLYTS